MLLLEPEFELCWGALLVDRLGVTVLVAAVFVALDALVVVVAVDAGVTCFFFRAGTTSAEGTLDAAAAIVVMRAGVAT